MDVALRACLHPHQRHDGSEVFSGLLLSLHQCLYVVNEILSKFPALQSEPQTTLLWHSRVGGGVAFTAHPEWASDLGPVA